MFPSKQVFYVLAILAPCLVFSQGQSSKTEVNRYEKYREALDFYNNREYSLSKGLFKEILSRSDSEETKDECRWYMASCELQSGGEGSDKSMLAFVNSFVASLKVVQGYHDLGAYYFLNNRFSDALIWLQKVEYEPGFHKSDELKFELGYCYFLAGKYIDAQSYFSKLSDHKIYGGQANYYLGYIAYKNNDYNKAKQYFKDLDRPEFEDSIVYYQAYISFVSGDYPKAIELANRRLMVSASDEETSTLNKLIGESYFRLGRFNKAIDYLLLYKGSLTNPDRYELGYAYLNQGDYEKAMEYFNKITGEQSSLSQNSYYHLGVCYFKTGDKAKALSAFTKSSQMGFDKQIQQDAWLNRARLSYEVEDSYQNTVMVLDSFIKKYPTSPNKVEIVRLLSNSLISSNNYDQALEEMADNPAMRNQAAYQKLSYAKGIKFYQEGRYDEAITYLYASTHEPSDSLYYAKARYRIAEALYKKSDYNGALLEFRDLQLSSPELPAISELQSLDYDIAYCYYQSGDFGSALEYFKKFTAQSMLSLKVADSWTRIADCYALKKNYEPALQAYQTAIAMNCPQAGYAVFRSAVMKQYIEGKTAFLEDYIRNNPLSAYLDQSYFEIAKLQASMKRYQQAIETYEKLKTEIPYSALYIDALVNEADIYEKTGKSEQAIDVYKTVVKDFPGTQQSIEAVGLAKGIYAKLDQLENYAVWIRQIKFNQNIDYSIDINAFTQAKRNYIEKSQDAGLKAYLNAYPEGLYNAEAKYLLGTAAEKRYDYAAAEAYFKALTEGPPNRFTEEALYRLIKYYISAERSTDAAPYLARLSIEAKKPAYKKFALLQIAEAAYLSDAYKQAEENLREAMKCPTEELTEAAELLQAKIYLKTNKTRGALASLKTLKGSKQPKVAAAAYYYEASLIYQEGRYEPSIDQLKKLINKYPEQREFCAKAMLLIADNYISLEDNFQASFTLERLIERYGDFSLLVAEAKAKKDKINR